MKCKSEPIFLLLRVTSGSQEQFPPAAMRGTQLAGGLHPWAFCFYSRARMQNNYDPAKERWIGTIVKHFNPVSNMYMVIYKY